MLDYYFSSFPLQIFFFILLAVAVVTLFYVHPVCDGVDSLLARLNLFRFRRFIIMFAFALMLSPMILPILNASYWGFGLVERFAEAGLVDGRLYAIDERSIGSGKLGPPRHYLRLHVIDLATGRRLYRRIVGDTGITVRSGPFGFGAPGEKHLLIRLDESIAAYDISSGSRDHVITKESLPRLVFGLGRQVTQFSFFGNTPILNVLTADGYNKLVNPFSLKLESSILKKYADPDAFRLRGPGHIAGSPLMLTTGPRKTIVDAGGSHIGGNEVFLDGFVLQFAKKGSIVIIASYPDMSKQSVILSGVSRVGKKLWQKKQEQFTSARTPDIEFSAVIDGRLIILMGGHACSINIADGGVVWKRRY